MLILIGDCVVTWDQDENNHDAAMGWWNEEARHGECERLEIEEDDGVCNCNMIIAMMLPVVKMHVMEKEETVVIRNTNANNINWMAAVSNNLQVHAVVMIVNLCVLGHLWMKNARCKHMVMHVHGCLASVKEMKQSKEEGITLVTNACASLRESEDADQNDNKMTTIATDTHNNTETAAHLHIPTVTTTLGQCHRHFHHRLFQCFYFSVHQT